MSKPEAQTLFATRADVPLGKRPMPEHYLQDTFAWLRANRPEFFTENGVRDFYRESVPEPCAAGGDNGKLQEHLTENLSTMRLPGETIQVVVA